jgi:deoxyguanosine kinase
VRELPSYIVVEGAIGAGKTSLALRLAERTGARTLLEEVEENPFLPRYYDDPRAYAFATQMFFLLSRHRQQTRLLPLDLFWSRVVSDYLFAKNRIFASVSLDRDELALFESIVPLVERGMAEPDLVVYLAAETSTLMRRIRKRGRRYERDISEEYVGELNEAYRRFFLHYDRTPLLVVRSDGRDFVRNEGHLDDLIRRMRECGAGTTYYIPEDE